MHLKDTISTYIEDNPVLKRLYRNVAIIFSGNVISSVIGLMTLMVMTRALSLESFGHYALITAFISLIDRLTSFQTWQALIHYGSHAQEQKDKPLLMSLFTFGWLLDTSSGLIGFVIACSAALFVPHWFGLDAGKDGALIITAIASTVLLFNWTSTPTAVLRLYDKFYAQALYQKITASLIFLGSLALWLSGSTDIYMYIGAWAIGMIIGRFCFLAFAVLELKRQETWNLSGISLKTLFAKTDGLWKFVITTNFDGIVRVLRDLDIFFVNAVLGTSAAGLYRVARKIAQIAGKITGPFYQAIYPELAKLHSQNKMQEFKKLMRQSSLTLGGVVSVVLIGFIATGWFALPMLFGPGYVEAYSVSVFCIASMTIWAFAQPLSPAMMALGKVQTIFVIHLVTTIAYAFILFFMMNSWNLTGAGIALFIFYALWATCMYIAFKFLIAYTPRQQNHSKT